MNAKSDKILHDYYRVIGKLEGQEEVLYGSYSMPDCKHEIQAEKAQWKEEGYKGLKIVTIKVEAAPDPDVYGGNHLTKHDITSNTGSGACVFIHENGFFTVGIQSSRPLLPAYFFATFSVDVLEQYLISKGFDLIIDAERLFMMQAPSFNFERSEEELVEIGLERGYITKLGKGKYLINCAYQGEV